MDPINDLPGLSGPPEYSLWCDECGERLIVQGTRQAARLVHSKLPLLCEACEALAGVLARLEDHP